MTLWKSDDELFALARRELYSAVIGDILDQLGFHAQFLPPQVQPLRPDMIVAGRAMTVLEADLPITTDPSAPAADHRDATAAVSPLDRPFGLMLEALDDLKPNEVYLCSGASPTYALWGELMSTRALYCGAAGAVLNGYSRDTRGILELGFPTFSWGRYAQDQAPRGKVVDFRIPVCVGPVRIEPGEVVFGDLDGVCVVPRAVEEETFTRALEKARGEKTVRKALEAGLPAAEAFARYGIL